MFWLTYNPLHQVLELDAVTMVGFLVPRIDNLLTRSEPEGSSHSK